LGGTEAMFPDDFEQGLFTPSPDTSRVREAESDLRAILSISSI
jgi:hypothetical protein